MILAALGGGLFMAGIVIAIFYLRPAPPKQALAPKPTLAQRWRAVSAGTRQRLIMGLILGLILGFLTKFLILIVIVPAALVWLPMLLNNPPTKERDLIIALETWARSLAAGVEANKYTLKEVIGVTRGSAPEALQGPVDRLYARMMSSWTVKTSLRKFADELNSPAADEVLIALVQAAEFNSGGLATALKGIAQNLHVASKNMLEVDVERAKGRDTMRIMAGFIGLTVVYLVFFGGSGQLDFYRTPIGVIAMLIVLSGFVGLMIWAKSITRVRPEPRILIQAPHEGADV